jgi:hypothetical protein
MNASITPKLDAAMTEFIKTLRRLDAEMTTLAPSASLESQLRATFFRQRIRITLMELESYTCMH